MCELIKFKIITKLLALISSFAWFILTDVVKRQSKRVLSGVLFRKQCCEVKDRSAQHGQIVAVAILKLRRTRYQLLTEIRHVPARPKPKTTKQNHQGERNHRKVGNETVAETTQTVERKSKYDNIQDMIPNESKFYVALIISHENVRTVSLACERQCTHQIYAQYLYESN